MDGKKGERGRDKGGKGRMGGREKGRVREGRKESHLIAYTFFQVIQTNFI